MRPLKLTIGLAALLLAGTWAHWAFFQWKGFEFQPACGIHDRYPDLAPATLKFLEGDLSDEFWKHASASVDTITGFIVEDRTRLELRDGRIYLPLSEYFRSPEKGKRTDGQREVWFHWVASTIAAEILETRKAEGRFTAEDQKDFMVFRQRWNMHKPMEPGECGFMEELIMKGGRFASE